MRWDLKLRGWSFSDLGLGFTLPFSKPPTDAMLRFILSTVTEKSLFSTKFLKYAQLYVSSSEAIVEKYITHSACDL